MSDPTLQRELAELHHEAGGGSAAGSSDGGSQRNDAGGERGPDYDGGQLAGGYTVVYEIASYADMLGEPWALRPEEKHKAARDLGKIADRHLPDDTAEMPPWADYVFAGITVLLIAAPRWAAYQEMQAQAEAEARRQAHNERPANAESEKPAEGEHAAPDGGDDASE